MINIFEIERIANEFGVSIKWFVEEREYYGAYDPYSKEIDIWTQMSNDQTIQTFFHELVHAIDPVCQRDERDVDDKDFFIAEATAEYAAKFIVGDKYVNDGNIDFYTEELPADVIIDAINRAEFFVAKIKEVI
jgi:Zn-dependent peptidase ImmA (M78 family)